MTTDNHDKNTRARKTPSTRVLKQAFFDRVWQHSPDNMFVIRRRGPKDYIAEAINPSMAKKLHLDPETTINRPLQALIAPDFLDNVIARYEDCIAQGCPVDYEESGAAPGHPPMYWNTLLVPAISADGSVTRIYGISRDISHIRRKEQELLHAQQELEKRVEERTRELQKLNHALHTLATQDALTQTYNRRHFFELASRLFETGVEPDDPVTLLMLDVDHFKQINDEYGHVAGDRMLQRIADACRTNLRGRDLFGRYGGEEFAIVLPATGMDNALKIAERIRETVADTQLEFKGHHIHCTVSLGLAAMHDGDHDFHRLLYHADAALLCAKRQGRNRVVCFVPAPDTSTHTDNATGATPATTPATTPGITPGNETPDDDDNRGSLPV